MDVGAVEQTVARALAEMPEYYLYDVELKGGGRSRVISVTVDRHGGLGIDDCAAISERLSEALDEEDPIEGSYRLDVASPGLERPLRRARHFEMSIGSIVRVKRADREPLVGVLVAADRDGIAVRRTDEHGIGDDAEAEVRVAYGDIARARTVVDWEAEIRSGSGKSRRDEIPARQGKTR